MNIVFEFLWNFIWLFLLVLIVYLVFINRRKKDYSKLKKNDPVKIFIARYNIDVRKTSYKKILNISAVINSFIISFASTLILFIDNVLWALLTCFVVVFGLIYVLYEITGRRLKSKEKEKKKNV